jgi:hypothetical protein
MAQLDMIIKKLKEEPFQKSQVKELVLDLELDDGFGACGFFNQFPSLQATYMKRTKVQQFQTMTTTSFQTKYIKFLHESLSFVMTLVAKIYGISSIDVYSTW